MKGFALDEKGDVILKNGEIQMVEGLDLTMQTCRTVIGTNKGEWFLDGQEGIRFDHILIKNPNYALVRDEIQSGLYQVDETMRITEMKHSLTKDRRLDIRFQAMNDAKEKIRGGRTY